MTSSKGNVVFDVVGTLVGYEAMFRATDERLGDKLRAEGIKPLLLCQIWLETAEREYTYLSMSGKYVGFAEVVQAIFWRMLFKAGIAEPRQFASSDDVQSIMDHGYKKLEMRPGARECIEKLREAGFQVWALTAADRSGCAAYFEQAGIDFPYENLLSCDSSSIGKPDPESYKPLLNQLSSGTQPRPWFAAAHMWDTSAAQRVGFRGAFCTVFEKEPLTEIFGEVDVVSSTLPGMAEGIIAASGQ
ncbi:hypothetical protein PRZ48_013119 [Zasmidium cellare]|uniref:2-haloalkanoic acid dehalogenase n=1 Tax=Zasmidium cellare TaxID=395010 RepID=A0ABR0E3Q9_ZASCE|nr:hypothetical protein PRZ48_013119 [Zasmidium cellare]